MQGVPQVSGKMSERERAICSRVLELRRSIKWSQKDFANAIGLTRHKLGNIEQGRTPLHYAAAWIIANAFGRALEWFIGYDAPPQGKTRFVLPMPKDTGLPKNALVSEVFEKFAGPIDEKRATEGQKIENQRLNEIQDFDMHARGLALKLLTANLESWLARLPADTSDQFWGMIVARAEEFIKGLPEEPAHLVKARHAVLVGGRRSVQLLMERTEGAEISFKKELTDSESSGIPVAVKHQMPNLLSRLRKATQEAGKMSALAAFLSKASGKKVPLASVSRWLSGKREPGGEVALLMLRWVEQQEMQK